MSWWQDVQQCGGGPDQGTQNFQQGDGTDGVGVATLEVRPSIAKVAVVSKRMVPSVVELLIACSEIGAQSPLRQGARKTLRSGGKTAGVCRNGWGQESPREGATQGFVHLRRPGEGERKTFGGERKTTEICGRASREDGRR